MKNTLYPLMFLCMASQAFGVEPPQPYNNSRYYHLWRDSIVTDKPEVVRNEVKVANDLDDWVLVSTAKYVDLQTVTMINKKDQSKRVTIPSPTATEENFEILELKQDPYNFLNTEAHIQKGAFKAWVKYDQQFLVLKKNSRPNIPKRVSATAAQERQRATPPLPTQASQAPKTEAAPKAISKKRPRVRYIPKPKK